MKNLEIKTKKMSLANIDGKLTPAEMENIMAGKLSSGTICAAVGFMYIVGMSAWEHPLILGLMLMQPLVGIVKKHIKSN